MSATDFVNEPHSAILFKARGQALNQVASESDPARVTVTDIATNEKPQNILADLKKSKTLDLPREHPIGN